MKYLDCSPCDVLEIRKRRLCYNDALHFCWGLFHSLIKQIKVLSICYLTRKTKYILGSVWQSMLRARATAKITASCSWESSLKISVRKIKHLIEKGALTPKSFANIVRLSKKFFSFLNKVVSKDQSVQTELAIGNTNLNQMEKRTILHCSILKVPMMKSSEWGIPLTPTNVASSFTWMVREELSQGSSHQSRLCGKPQREISAGQANLVMDLPQRDSCCRWWSQHFSETLIINNFL